MDEQSVTVMGIHHEDGTLELAERLTLPAGPVEVTIRPILNIDKSESLIEYLQRTRAELEASGAVFQTKEEIDAYLEDIRDWGEDRIEEARGSSKIDEIQP